MYRVREGAAIARTGDAARRAERDSRV